MHTAATRPSVSAPHRSRADDVYAQLKQDVAEFKLVPGDRFTENELSERLGVSRTPVRQALFRLQQEPNQPQLKIVILRLALRRRPESLCCAAADSFGYTVLPIEVGQGHVPWDKLRIASGQLFTECACLIDLQCIDTGSDLRVQNLWADSTNSRGLGIRLSCFGGAARQTQYAGQAGPDRNR